MTVASIEPGLLMWPFIAGLLVLATHVPLGRRVLARGVIFLDLAVAQIAVLGVIAAHAAGWDEQGGQTQLAAVAAAVTGATLLAWFESRWPAIQEAVIGSAYVVAASLAVLLLANDPHGGEHMSALLTGQILWVNGVQVMQTAVLYAVLLAFWRWRGAQLAPLEFYLIFALAITASVQLIGVYLVFASLILPALAVRGLPGHAALWRGVLLGAASYAAGLAASALFDWPSGPAIVIALAMVSIATAAGRVAAGRLQR